MGLGDGLQNRIRGFESLTSLNKCLRGGMVDTSGLDPDSERSGGSSPSEGTIIFLLGVFFFLIDIFINKIRL